ncbi:MAG: Rdx family protein [Actinobacteria bacterium]|nr:Rdx family protein [Actinomycetota bacterium]MBV8597995.1 Rdx family protein [Actinomycetota bacterium]
MLNSMGHRAEAEPGQKSQFDVLVDGELVFSKYEVGRFPEPGEVEGLLS